VTSQSQAQCSHQRLERDLIVPILNPRPKILQAFCVLFHLENDIGSYENDIRKGEVANGVNCYMKQHGVTKELAVSKIKKMIRDN